MPESAVRTFTTADEYEPRAFEIGDQLANLAGHSASQIFAKQKVRVKFPSNR